ncbi:MAG: hypothetical protein D6788_03660 [Planctomycetota bacterium]|nr:MAG: hypothetical protein D6788_03660 [Planctomycetota bacterium]
MPPRRHPPPGAGMGGEKSGTPVIVPQENPCFWCVDQPCVCACGVGALISQPPGLSRMGIARVDGERCYRTSGQPCDYCVTRCPLGEGAIGFPDAGPPVVRDGCTGCGMCAYLCPPGAIRIEPEEKSP